MSTKPDSAFSLQKKFDKFLSDLRVSAEDAGDYSVNLMIQSVIAVGGTMERRQRSVLEN